MSHQAPSPQGGLGRERAGVALDPIRVLEQPSPENDKLSLGTLAVRLGCSNKDVDHLVRATGVSPTLGADGRLYLSESDAAMIADQERIDRQDKLHRLREIRKSWTWED